MYKKEFWFYSVHRLDFIHKFLFFISKKVQPFYYKHTLKATSDTERIFLQYITFFPTYHLDKRIYKISCVSMLFEYFTAHILLSTKIMCKISKFFTGIILNARIVILSIQFFAERYMIFSNHVKYFLDSY